MDALTKERVAQRHRLDPLHLWVACELRIYEEKDRHVDRLPGPQALLLKAKALNLAEIRRDLPRRHAVGRHPDDVFFAVVRGRVEGQRRFAREHPHLALLRGEFPRQDVGDAGVEGDAEARGGGDGD